jgi:secondary thiamine-phosphate synthase enzyme
MIKTSEISFKTSGSGDIIDITPDLRQAISTSEINSGTLTAFVPGSTAGLTTIEHEPGLLKDVPELMEKLIPSNRSYHHDDTWHDGNGFSHLRSALIGPDITWQQVVFLEFDNRPRSRTVVLQIIGD